MPGKQPQADAEFSEHEVAAEFQVRLNESDGCVYYALISLRLDSRLLLPGQAGR